MLGVASRRLALPAREHAWCFGIFRFEDGDGEDAGIPRCGKSKCLRGECAPGDSRDGDVPEVGGAAGDASHGFW